MINPHIVVGEGRRCMCGMYDGAPLRCGQILAALAALQTLVVECADPAEQCAEKTSSTQKEST